MKPKKFMKNILIKNGTIVNPDDKRNPERITNVFIREGKISKISANFDQPNADIIINAKGKIVTAGLVDMHVHLREPGREDKETIATATRAAAKGGVTTILGMPNTTPAIDNQTTVRFVLDRARETGVINVLTSGSLTQKGEGKNLAEIWELREAGASVIIDDGPEEQTMALQRLALKYCQTFQMPLMAHPEDAAMKGNAVINEGWISTQLGLEGSSTSTETLVIARTIELLRETPVPYHFTHISAAESVNLIRAAKSEGLPVTCDVTTHHLALTDKECLDYNTLAKVAPPLRSEFDRQTLLAGLADGTIDAIITDHAPHLLLEKFVPFSLAANGIIGLETLFSIAYTELVVKKVLSLSDLIAKITINPAKIIRTKAGSLREGGAADISIWDTKTKFKINKNMFESKGRNTPFHGKTCRGFANEVICGGKLLVKKGKLLV